MSKQRKINIGDRHDRLEVVADLGVRQIGKRRLRVFLCRCDCGAFVEVAGAYIGRTVKSCGCLQRESRERPIAPGAIFERLEVIGRADNSAGRGCQYLCRCDCGNAVTVSGSRLRSGETRSCGCLHDDLLRDKAKIAYARNFVGGTSLPKIRNDNIQRNNTSGVRGVSWHKGVGKWAAQIRFRKHLYHLGYFDSLEDAAAARRKAEAEYFGEFLDEQGK